MLQFYRGGMNMNEKKREILDWFKEVTTQTNIKQLLRDVGVSDASFYSGRYSLENMLAVKKELQKRLKELSKM